MQVTTKTLKRAKARCVIIACQIAHSRDTACIICGRVDGKLDASHIIPRSRGFWYASDPSNICIMCSYCHRRWHEDPRWGAASLRMVAPELAEYAPQHSERVNVASVQNRLDTLERQLREVRGGE